MYLGHHTNSNNDITATICMISHPVYVRHFVHPTYGIIPTMYEITNLYVDYTTLGICMTSFALQKTLHPLCHTKKQSLCLHIHFRLTSHPLYQTLHQLYLCHHTLYTDITHTFVWYHTHYICDIICTIYNIISTSYVIPLFYIWQHNLDIWNHIQYAVQNIHYPCDITVTSLWHNTYSIKSITPTLCVTSYTLCLWHIHFIWHHTKCCDHTRIV